MTLTQAEMEARYDATRLSPVAANEEHTPLFYELKAWIDQHFDGEPGSDMPAARVQAIAPEPLSAQEEEILNLLLKLSGPDPDELPSAADAAYEQLLASTVTSIGQILCEHDAEYAERFAAGYRDGQAIVRALQAEERGEDIDEIIRMLEQMED